MSGFISDNETPDPWMIKYNGAYLLTFTGGDHIDLWRSSLLQDFRDNVAAKRTIWRPTDSQVTLVDVWAPEIHIVDDYWWVYFAGANPDPNPDKQNASHRMYALRGPHSSTDPMDVNSKFTYEGLVRGLPVNQWAIDGTIFHINQQLYFVYSGWPLTATDNLKQELFITRMVDPMTADPSTGVHMISTPTFPWESWRDPGNGQVHHINEGPAWLEMGSFKGIIFSASASWTSDYKMGTLQYLGGDPLEISPWKKYPTELLCNNKNGKGPYAPGHCSFVTSPDDTQTWVVFHATAAPGDWHNRKGRAQMIQLQADLPFTGLYPLPDGPQLVPSGTFVPAKPTPFPETVLGPLPNFGTGQNTNALKQKGKVVWQNLKRRMSIKPSQGKAK